MTELKFQEESTVFLSQPVTYPSLGLEHETPPAALGGATFNVNIAPQDLFDLNAGAVGTRSYSYSSWSRWLLCFHYHRSYYQR